MDLETLIEELEFFLIDNAHRMTCGEAEFAANAFNQTGRDGSALLDVHSYGDDDPEDVHYNRVKED